MEEHPTKEALRRFFSGSGSREDNARVVWHLIAGCGVCHAGMSALPESPWLLAGLLEIPDQPPQRSSAGASYEWTFARADRMARRLIEQAQRQDKDPIAELLLLPRSKPLAAVRRRLADPEAVEALLTRSRQLRYESPKLMLLFAELARMGAEGLARDRLGDRAFARLPARAFSQLTAALRVHGRFLEAEQALARAEEFWKRDPRDLLMRAELLEHKASLRYTEGHHLESQRLARESVLIHESMGDRHLAARARVVQAISHFECGDAAGSVSLLEAEIPRIDCARDPSLLFAAYHNLAASHVRLGQPSEGVAVLDSVRDLYRQHADLSLRLKSSWLQGRLLLEVGHLESAERFLTVAYDGYIAESLHHEAAEVSVSLSEVHRRLAVRTGHHENPG